jgi:hypothetical protein
MFFEEQYKCLPLQFPLIYRLLRAETNWQKGKDSNAYKFCFDMYLCGKKKNFRFDIAITSIASHTHFIEHQEANCSVLVLVARRAEARPVGESGCVQQGREARPDRRHDLRGRGGQWERPSGEGQQGRGHTQQERRGWRRHQVKAGGGG